jgi:uncharacterized protein (TIGR00290 family)
VESTEGRAGDRAVVLWTGGKDCCLALHDARAAGVRVVALVTFGPRNPRFRAHPVALMERQARALGLPHEVVVLEEPLRASYVAALADLRRRHDLRCVVSGDLAEAAGHAGFMADVVAAAGLRLVRPLWQADRAALLARLLREGFTVVFSAVRAPWLDASWVGRRIDARAVAELRALGAVSGLDLCGENGEYHTMVLDAPLFREPVRLEGPGVGREGPLWFLDLGRG